jgi:hypothetical protein
MQENEVATREKQPVDILREKGLSLVFEESAQGKRVVSGVTFNGKKIIFSDGVSDDKINELANLLKEVTGTYDINLAMDFLTTAIQAYRSKEFSSSDFERLVSFLRDLQPKDGVEARLLAQHLVLNESGMFYMRIALDCTSFEGKTYYTSTANKMFRLAQDSVLTLMKYRSKGQQQINIVHMNGDSKAVFSVGGGSKG